MQNTQQNTHPSFFYPYKFTEKELSIFVGKDGLGIKSHLKKFGRIGIRGVSLSVQLNGIHISRAQCHDDVMKVVGYLGITLTEMFPRGFYKHQFTDETFREFIGENGCNVKAIGQDMEHKPFLHATKNGVLIKAVTWQAVEETKKCLRDKLGS